MKSIAPSSFLPYSIQSIRMETPDTCIVQVVSEKGNQLLPFLPGQYFEFKNPGYQNPEEVHCFSVASSPSQNYLEFCIKIYGKWTKAVSELSTGNVLQIAGPLGSVTFDPQYSNSVFLVGGVGIAPVMSMIRTIADKKSTGDTTLLYGSRTPDQIAYNSELTKLSQIMPNLKIVHIMSHVTPEDPWKGYRGFITSEIIQKEVDLTSAPVFYMYGPAIFVEKMQTILAQLGVKPDHIKFETH